MNVDDENDNDDPTGMDSSSSPIASLLLRHLYKSYITVEGISAKHIGSLVRVFNIFLFLSIEYSTYAIVASNTAYRGWRWNRYRPACCMRSRYRMGSAQD